MSFNVANPSHPQTQVQKASFNFSPTVTRFEHILTSGGKARSTPPPLLDTGGTSISVRFTTTPMGQSAPQVELGGNGF